MDSQGLVALAQRLGAPVLVFDLETTTMRGKPNFGITEFAGLVTYPAGKQAWFVSLVNPEQRIDPQ